MSSTNELYNDYQRGESTALAPTWRELAARDSKPLPKILLEDSSPNLGSEKIPPERYTSYEFHRREVEKVWKRSWQVACREEEIPGVGDHQVYEVAGLSFLIVRTAPATIKGYWNVCLHRGRRLVDHSGCAAKTFRCGYHAWTWDTDGKLVFYPGQWDFPDVVPQERHLRQVQCDTWGGFVFINPDLEAPPLSEHLGSLRKHFERWPLERRFTLWHVRKTIRANWKIAMEAFLEGYHVVATHPQIHTSVAEHAAQYDVYDEGNAHFSRSVTPSGIPSKWAKKATALDAIADVWAVLSGLRQDEAGNLPPEIKDRASLAEWRRQAMKSMTRANYSSLSDAEMLDSFQYYLFPNFCPWYGEGLPLSYVFRPNADSPDTSFFDVWMLIRAPDEGPAPPAPKMVIMGPDDPFEPIIGAMGTVFDQDDQNMPFVQIGMKSWPGSPEGCTLSRYQEIRIRHYHQVLMKKLAQP